MFKYLPIFLAFSVLGDIIPEDRRINWSYTNLGIAGGIPDSSLMTVYTNIPAGTALSYTETAVSRTPSNQVADMAAGSYAWSGNFTWSGNGNVLRGAGISNTIITVSSYSGRWMILGGLPCESCFDTEVDLLSTAIKGTNVIHVNTPAWARIGSLICIDETNETAVVGESGLLPPPAFSGAIGQREVDFGGINRLNGMRSLGQLVRVIATNATNITIEIPTYKAWRTNFHAQISQPGYNSVTTSPRMRIGLENLSIHFNFDGSDDQGVIQAFLMDSCWMKDVEIRRMPAGQGWFARQNYRCEFRRVYIHDSRLYQGGDGYGIDHYNNCCGNLTIDSIFDNLHLAQTYRYATMGNAIAYCYQKDGFNNSVQTASFSHHGMCSGMNLAEGNVFEPKILGDNTHRGSWTSTIFRNRVIGIRYEAQNTGLPLNDQGNDDGSGDQTAVSIEVTNRYWNIVGNVLGVPGMHNKLVFHQGNQGHGSGGTIYGMGAQENISQLWTTYSEYSHTNGLFILIHHNADTLTATNNGITWNLPPGQNIQEFTIPNSYIYTTKPTDLWPPNWDYPMITPGITSTDTNRDVIKWQNTATYRYYTGITNFPVVGQGYSNNPYNTASAIGHRSKLKGIKLRKQ